MKRRKFILGAGAAAAGGASLLGSGAFTSVEADRSIAVDVASDENAFLRLAACEESPNSPYVRTEDGTMAIDLSEGNGQVMGDGVNADAITRINSVFEICNQGTQRVCVSMNFDPKENGESQDAVKFFREPDSIQVGPDRDDGAFLLDTGECACFSLEIDTRGINADSEKADNLVNELPDADGELQIIAAAEGSQIDTTSPCYSEPGFPQTEEKIYVTNSEPQDDNGDEIAGTQLLSVEALDSGSGEAILNNLGLLPADDFDQVDSMALTPDGEELYFYDKNTASLGRWETPVAQNSLKVVDSLDNPGGIVLGEFVPSENGPRLLVVSADNDGLYEIVDYDTTDPSLSKLGDTGVNVEGADIEWVSEQSQLYLYTNADQNLYELDNIDNPSTEQAREVGEKLTGLARGETGTDIIGSVSGGSGGEPGEIVRFDVTGTGIERFDMRLDGKQYEYTYGDMASWTS